MIVGASEDHAEPTIRTGKLAVNLDTQVVTVDDKPVHLTGKEHAILELLSLRKGTVLTKKMFLNQLYRGAQSLIPRSLMSSSANCAKSSSRQRAAIITSKRCGAAAMCSATRRQRRPPRHARDDAGGSLRDGSHR